MEARRRALQRARPTPIEATSDDKALASLALDRALTRGVAAWHEARRVDRSVDLGPIGCLAEQLRRAAGGDPTLVHTPMPPAQITTFVSVVRRSLLEDAANGGTPPGLATELSAQLLALEKAAEAAVERAGPPPSLWNNIDGTDVVVEVAHDMRSPLTSILFLVETLRTGHSGPVNAVQERQLALVYSAAFGLSSIVSDAIELARGEDRLIDRTPIAFSVGEMFRSVYDILLPMAEEKGLAIKLAPLPCDFRVGYPTTLCRVLLNLATNAVKFTSQGSVELAAVPASPTRVEFSVRDTGPGIPPEVMRQLFEPFRRQEAGTHSFSSAGLGLAICSRLVKRMNSELKVETSRQGTGSRFSFELDLPVESRFG